MSDDVIFCFHVWNDLNDFIHISMTRSFGFRSVMFHSLVHWHTRFLMPTSGSVHCLLLRPSLFVKLCFKHYQQYLFLVFCFKGNQQDMGVIVPVVDFELTLVLFVIYNKSLSSNRVENSDKNTTKKCVPKLSDIVIMCLSVSNPRMCSFCSA